MTTRLIENDGHPYTVPATRVPNVSRPEFFRFPKTGGDPYFGLGRSYYYRGEELGYWRLVRIRERGKLRGLTLVPYDDIAAFVRKQMEATK
jgi:hypothetical protein